MSGFTEYDATGIEYYTISNFTFSTSEKLDIKVAYRIFNPFSPRTVLIPTCFGGRINNTLNFSSSVLSDYRVIVVAMVGNGESSSPSNSSNFPKSNPLPRLHQLASPPPNPTPPHHPRRRNRLQHGRPTSLLHYWAVMHSNPSAASASLPHLTVKSIVAICASARTSGHNYAFLEGSIAAVETSFDYARGQYRASGTRPAQGLRAFGRAYAAWLTSPEWFGQELWRKLGTARLKDWLHLPAGSAVFEWWDAEDMLVLTRMWQAGDVGACLPDAEGGDGYTKALEGVECRVLVVPSGTDQYFRREDSEIEVKHLKRGRVEVIETMWGHIAGAGANPADTEFLEAKIKEFLGAEEGQKL